MTHPDLPSSFDPDSLQETLHRLEKRLARIESYLGLPPMSESAATEDAGSMVSARARGGEESDGLELRVGEFGLAWIGSIVSFLGLVFLSVYVSSLGYQLAASVIGGVAAAGLYFLSQLWRQSVSHVSRIMESGSFLLLYYTLLRLHFFTGNKLVGSSALVIALLVAVVTIQLWMAVRKDSQSLGVIAILLGIGTALLIDKTQITLPLMVWISALAVALQQRRRWNAPLAITIAAVYLAHLLWLAGNPIAGHEWRAVTGNPFNLVCLFAYATVFAAASLFPRTEGSLSGARIVFLLFNCAGFSFLTLLAVLAQFTNTYSKVYLAVALLFLLFAIVQWLGTHQQLAPAIYACLGYMALSISIYGYAAIPGSFFWLSLQSLLVVSMALWFRSRILVVMNSFIYAGILLAYLVISPSSHLVNASFALVAMGSARVMNWQKERLTLLTDMLRNVYLSIAFVLVLYTLYQAAPPDYVTVAWATAAAGFFLLSYLLKNMKYRLMAVLALLFTALYLFFIDLPRLDPRFRVVAFLFVGVIALVISLFYTRIRRLLGKGTNS